MCAGRSRLVATLGSRAKSASLICERPALWRQTNRTLATSRPRPPGWRAADQLVGERADPRAGDRPGEVDPEVVQFAGDERRPEPAGRVHRGAGDRAAEQRVEADDAADRDRRAAPTARVSVATAMITNISIAVRTPRRPGRCRRRRVGSVAPSSAGFSARSRSSRAAARGPGDLGCDVGERLAGREVASQRERQGHRRVDVGTGEVAGGVDHGHDHETEDEGDPHRPEPARARSC